MNNITITDKPAVSEGQYIVIHKKYYGFWKVFWAFIFRKKLPGLRDAKHKIAKVSGTTITFEDEK